MQKSKSEKLPYTTDAPNGINANFAILKHWSPNGIPTIVIQKSIPVIAATAAIQIPLTKIQIIFRSKEPTPPPYTTSLPNGKNAREANLKHCIPIGIPTIVIHQSKPASSQLSP